MPISDPDRLLCSECKVLLKNNKFVVLKSGSETVGVDPEKSRLQAENVALKDFIALFFTGFHDHEWAMKRPNKTI